MASNGADVVGDDDDRVPLLSRRREVGGGSSRSLLMMILGGFVLPFGEPVWTATLIRALGLLGVEERSARQSLARTAADGWLASERVGRRVRWSVTDSGRHLLTAGTQRMYAFGSQEHTWDGRWFVILLSLPEPMRTLRHKLRTQLSWAGFGSPATGVWISPHIASVTEASRILEELELSTEALCFIAEYHTLGISQQEMIAAAWDLADVEQRYEKFIAEFADAAPENPNDYFVSHIRLFHEWRRFPFLDPQLPRVLLPQQWSGTTAKQVFQEKDALWREHARRRWSELAAGQ